MGAVNSLTCYAFCIMLSEGEILWDWHLIKGSFQSIFWSGVWNWRSLIWVCERCRSGEHLQGCWQSWSAVSQSQQKQIYNIMQSVDGKRAAVLPQATFTLSPSHFAQMYFLSSGNWLVNIQLIGWSLHVNSKPISRSNFKSIYRMTQQYLLVRANIFTVVLMDVQVFKLFGNLLLLNKRLVILFRFN